MTAGFHTDASEPHLHLQLSGRLTAEDYHQLVPVIDREVKEHGRLRRLDRGRGGAIPQARHHALERLRADRNRGRLEEVAGHDGPVQQSVHQSRIEVVRTRATHRRERLARFLTLESKRIQSVPTIADAIAAVLQHASAPASIARGASDEKSARRVGAMAPSPPI